MPTKYDAIVIGGGPGGYSAAIRLAQLKKSVLCIERERVGGVCLNWGCMPSKALLHVGEVIAAAREAANMGIDFGGAPQINLPKLNQWKSKMVDDLVNGIITLFKVNKVDSMTGDVEFMDAKSVRVKKQDGRAEQLFADSFIIATGSEPVSLPGFERDSIKILNSDDAVTLAEIPKSILILGAGVIGLEFATIYKRLGAEVTVVELADRALAETDIEISNLLVRTLKQKQGIDIHLKTKAVRAQEIGKRVRVTFEGDIAEPMDFEKILVAVGRRPRTDKLALERVGVTTERGFIPVNEQRQTNVPHIYAVGDVTGAPLLAHKAMKEGVVAAEVIAGLPSAFDPLAMPNCVYTDPQVATVGMSEEQAKAAGYDIGVGKFRLAALGRARTIGLSDGMVKVITDKKTDLVIGVGIFSPMAETMVAECTLAIEMGATAEDIGLTIHPHPTFSEPIMEAAEVLHGRAIHIANAPVTPVPAKT
ncbi:MAG TPA: dihydrolipoyl dehydrogenase, partial [Candidatus Eremiobacteraceae bacterium]|nr:dihydrolipoyl dehydrogenase [Candidatus Eremiobacteraceae bacterium]